MDWFWCGTVVDSDDVGIGWFGGDKSFENEIDETVGDEIRWLDNDGVGEIFIDRVHKSDLNVVVKSNSQSSWLVDSSFISSSGIIIQIKTN